MLQVIKDGNGADTSVFIPMSDWNTLTQMHDDLKQLIKVEQPVTKKKLSDLAGKLSNETAAAMQKYVTESRQEWEERLKKQF